MQKNDLEKVWMIRNFKTVYRNGKRNKNKKRIEDKRAANSLHSKVNDTLIPQTPPERIYMGLSNMATRNKQNLLPTERIIAEMNQGLGINLIGKWQLQKKENVDSDNDGDDDDDIGIGNLEELASKPLK
ncbi:unnamed protein product [Rhizophagus irregularis]|uniref:Uncharacterized protein n=1 Tax=Rhizophagus irregularis TaxID=588596 RepID=A0A2I1HN58_9GLOM|nr:hypothetical protein RhiirA4_412683 [Rhizophagus irregularis]CAB4403322.1 unnamed protein product [Rhizophagus irregularis]